MAITLKVYRTLFRKHTKMSEDDLPNAGVNDFLNDGWSKVAEETRALLAVYKDGLITDQADYQLSGNTIEVAKVDLYRGGDRVVTLKPEPGSDLLLKVGDLDSGVPCRCSWGLIKRDGETATYELHLSPPPSWTESNGLVVTVAVRPERISADDAEPDMADYLGRAGLWWACYVATGDNRFARFYNEEIRQARLHGLTQTVFYKRSAWGSAGAPNPNAYWREA